MEGYISKEQRKTILLLGDDIRFFSGVGSVAKNIVFGTAHYYNWVILGASAHPTADTGKMIDLSKEVDKLTGIEGSSVLQYCNVGYGDHDLLLNLILTFKPDAITFITDPRYWIWLFQMENEIRKIVPLVYINIWDDLPAPLYNKSYYDSCDALLCISKQTKNIVEMVLGKKKEGKLIKYFPHGINPNVFYPISTPEDYEDLQKFKKDLFKGLEFEFVVLFNSRNLGRKAAPTLIMAFQQFCKIIGPQESERCALVLHTDPVDNVGTDLPAVIEALVDTKITNIILSTGKLTPQKMNHLYNSCDVVCLPSSNEGWGLSLTEGMMAGKMIIANVTGGMQDQMRFEDENENWVDFTPEFPSNHQGRYRDHGVWAESVFPNNISLIGSPVTPYIWDDRCDFRDLAWSLTRVYNLGPLTRRENGLKGREWAMSDEARFTDKHMCKTYMESIDELIQTWTPREPVELVKIEFEESTLIPHEIIY
jgi:glycosyltransferase involved in cell wall biosynthesis